MASYAAGSGPATDLIAVTPADATDLPDGPCRGIVIGAAGAVACVMASGESRTIPSGLLAVGVIHPLRIVRILDTGTDADPIWVAY